jgi:hypothetical protein
MSKDQVEQNFSFTVHTEKDQIEQSFSCAHGKGPWWRIIFPVPMPKDKVIQNFSFTVLYTRKRTKLIRVSHVHMTKDQVEQNFSLHIEKTRWSRIIPECKTNVQARTRYSRIFPSSVQSTKKSRIFPLHMKKDQGVEQSFSCTHDKGPGREEFFVDGTYVKGPGRAEFSFTVH